MGQRCAPIFGFIGAISYILNAVVFLHTSDVLQNTIYTCSFVVFVSIGLAAYRNLSFVILRRLLTEVNVIMIIIFTVINTIIDSASDRHDYLRHIVMAYIYLTVVFALIVLGIIQYNNPPSINLENLDDVIYGTLQLLNIRLPI